MSVIKAQRFKPYSGARRSMTSMLSRTKQKTDATQLADQSPSIDSNKKHSFKSIFRRVVDSFATGLTLSEEKIEGRRRAKLRKNIREPVGAIPLLSEDDLVASRQTKLVGATPTRVLRSGSSQIRHSRPLLSMPLEDTLANFHISEDVQLLGLQDDDPITPLAIEVLSAVGIDDSSESSHAPSTLPLTPIRPFVVHAFDREVDTIPKVIMMASQSRPESLAGQFWRRKASRIHRVDGSSTNDRGANRKMAKSSAPYARNGERARRAMRESKEADAFADDEADYSHLLRGRSVFDDLSIDNTQVTGDSYPLLPDYLSTDEMLLIDLIRAGQFLRVHKPYNTFSL
ncbi:hypothetical protein HWV62_30344 [Athelia sp. TMB]|nr:hypothetical protein HWV62_30344 [Athelia sp. TMB]